MFPWRTEWRRSAEVPLRQFSSFRISRCPRLVFFIFVFGWTHVFFQFSNRPVIFPFALDVGCWMFDVSPSVPRAGQRPV